MLVVLQNHALITKNPLTYSSKTYLIRRITHTVTLNNKAQQNTNLNMK